MNKSVSCRARLALDSRDLALAERLASQLSQLGFRIRNVTQRGISFEGTAELFQRVFQSEVGQTESGRQFVKPPVLPPSIAKAGASVYFPTKPEFF